jgi:hypothetical protein
MTSSNDDFGYSSYSESLLRDKGYPARVDNDGGAVLPRQVGMMPELVGVPKLTLPTDSDARKEIPLRAGCYNYFPAALAGVARWSKQGNDKHNPGQPLHHARGKSMDHEECIERHGTDLADLQAAHDRAADFVEQERLVVQMLDEYDARAWRALAASQEFREKHGLAPLAPGAKL